MLSTGERGVAILGDPVAARLHARLFGWLSLAFVGLLALLVAWTIDEASPWPPGDSGALPVLVVVCVVIATIAVSCMRVWLRSRRRGLEAVSWPVVAATDAGIAAGEAAPIPWTRVERIDVRWHDQRLPTRTIGVRLTDALSRAHAIDGVIRMLEIHASGERAIRVHIGPAASDDEFRVLLAAIARRLSAAGGELARADERLGELRRS